MNKEVVAMLLAGGEGKRLGPLTRHLAKPAVPFGGKYRIIDFTLSNCTNSRIETVGVLTQYSPLVLNQHIGAGSPWGLDLPTEGLSILSPYTAKEGGDWYKGTADAIYQNIHYIDQYNPENVLVISGDHIYHMDYNLMLEQHIETNADATISVIEVPWEEASRFGILNTTDSLSIYEFEEKPAAPKNNLASMGIYLFKWQELRKHLIEDAICFESTHDFGKDLIPKMLSVGNSMYAYQFEGYWKDVGTIQSYWEANMDLLNEDLSVSLNCKKWRTYSKVTNEPPQFIAETANIQNALIHSGSYINGTIDTSVLFENVSVGAGSTISHSIIHPNVTIGKNVRIERAIIKENTTIPAGTVISTPPTDEPMVIDDDTLPKRAVTVDYL
ncbi:glucose-1-phosphate adenylyltransferase [Salsuginibacillus kocurii]|uniref:glucose-1-phosphate adenylyltransferase n=1 Tax=Salsuginibacillus kocurii TaxID=427078 RepID=UPI00037A94EF|nr:glucose-1-phosphate adenylyltransferase [Salsuginibacillus kocurii]